MQIDNKLYMNYIKDYTIIKNYIIPIQTIKPLVINVAAMNIAAMLKKKKKIFMRPWNRFSASIGTR